VATAAAPLSAGQIGFLTREIWNEMASQTALEPHGMYWRPADSVVRFQGSSAPANIGDLYVSRIRGYLIPPVSGNYQFWISSNDDAQFSLSSTASKFGKEPIASVVGQTAVNAWDTQANQKSAPRFLHAGQRYFIETIQQDKGSEDHVELAWQIQGGLRELIPATALESFTVDVNDTDGDELHDTWEALHSFTVGNNAPVEQAPLADPDEDGYSNWEESLLNMDPWTHGGLPGNLLLETWGGIPGTTVDDLVRSPHFADPPDVSEFISSAFTGFNRGDSFGSRMRGFVIPPVTGTYRFFIAGDNGSELLLSTSQSQDDARTIAAFVGYTARDQWFKYPSQSSEPVILQAGQKLFIEALTKDGSGSDFLQIGWQKPGSSNVEILPATALESYAPLTASGENTALAALPQSPDPVINFAGPNASPLRDKPDTSNLTAKLTSNILGYWIFEQRKAGTKAFPVIFPEVTGKGYDITSYYAGNPQLFGMPSKAAQVAMGANADAQGSPSLTMSAKVLKSSIVGRSIPKPFSISFWVKFGPGSLRNMPLDLTPLSPRYSHWRIIYSMFQDDGINQLGQSRHQIGRGRVLAVRRDNNVLDWYVGGYAKNTAANGNPQTRLTDDLNGHFRMPSGLSIDDGKWHFITVTYDPSNNGQIVYVDRKAAILKKPYFREADTHFNPDSAATSISFGGLHPKHLAYGFRDMTIDRLRFHSKRMEQNDVLSFFQQDLDNDGLWDITENNTAFWRDQDADGVKDNNEISYISSPYIKNAASSDIDDDGLTDLQEQRRGTRLDLADTDGDLLPDGWEVKMGLNPLAKNNLNVDSDKDGLTLLQEYIWNTDPRKADTDGDGKNDFVETQHKFSNPNDATDKGNAVPADQRFSVRLGIGDKSGSLSEDYVMNVFELNPKTGAETLVYVLRSGGHGQYKEETRSFFRKGRSYSFQIDWQSTNGKSQKNSSGQITDAADFDYTFKVIPQGDTGGAILIDSYKPKSSSSSDTIKILNDDASNVAETPSEFSEKYESRRVGLLPVEVVSRDKYLAGSISLPPGWDSLEMEFVGPDGSLGKYGNLLGGGSTKIYDKVEDVMADADYAAGGQANTQKVWFVRDSTDTRKINYYTCFDSTGDVQIKLYLNGNSDSIGKITHKLTAAEDFAAVIDYVDEWVKGTSFDFSGGVVTPPLAMRGMSMHAAGGGGIHNLTRAALIPFFNVINNVEGLGSLSFGLFDGIKEGVSDDWKLIQLIKSGVLGAGGWAIQAAEEELTKWKDDPLKRAAELKKAADRLCQEWVFSPMKQVRPDLSTWEGFKNRSWQVWKSIQGTADKAWVLTKDSWGAICTGFSGWLEDYGNRMMEGAEKTHWSEQVMVMDKFQQIANAATITGCYALGYNVGYVAEQVAIGIATGGVVKVGAILTKGGVSLSAQLAARRVLPVVARLHLVKKWAASVAISIEMKAAVERGLVEAAETPLSLAVKDSAAEVIERGMARATYERASFSTSKVLDEVLNGVFLKKLIATPGLEGRFWQRMGEWFHLLADDATAAASKGWVKVFNRSLKFDGDVLLDDRMPDLYKLAKADTTAGKKALKKSLDEFGATNGSGKLWLRDLDTVYEDMYHHLSASNFNRLRVQNGNAYLSEFSGDRGWYVTPDKFTNAEDAKSFLQLNNLADARYRCKFKTAQAKDNLKAARGRFSEAEYFEFICKDFPLNASGQGGTGGGSQLLLDSKEVLLDEVFDTVLQRNLTITEIQNLGGL
jgi:hypothetical protein